MDCLVWRDAFSNQCDLRQFSTNHALYSKCDVNVNGCVPVSVFKIGHLGGKMNFLSYLGPDTLSIMAACDMNGWEPLF